MNALKTALVSIAALSLAACSTTDTNPYAQQDIKQRHAQSVQNGGTTYSDSELVGAVSTLSLIHI